MAVTTPVASTDAIVALLLVHVPAVPVVVSVVVAPTQAVEAPETIPASGSALTVIALLVVAVPQLLITV
jgi:hypothetical protein